MKDPHRKLQRISDAKTVILIDGDNCISIALLGIEQIPEDVLVIAYFSQKGMFDRFRATVKLRKNRIISRYILPAPQSVDRAMISDCKRYEANGQRVYFVSCDKGFLAHCSPLVRCVHSIDEIRW